MDSFREAAHPNEPWWRDAVFYQVYLRSFADGNGDGTGDLRGLHDRLPYLKDLGVDALWLNPFYPSPMADGGYDVADPRDVDPMFGNLADFDAMLAEAHRLGLRVTIDIVPNHSSDRHSWFQAALAAGPGSPERGRYIFRDGRGEHGELPPNNWWSVFGGPAWTRVPDGQWYLHMFAPEQPDLNWRDPAVGDDYEQTLRFWLDRGVDGFRIDVAHGLYKDEALRDNPGTFRADLFGHGEEDRYSWNQPEVHEVYRRWRRLLESYDGDRMVIGEVWVREDADLARYVRPDELHLAFNFRPVRTDWSGPDFRQVIDDSLAAMASVGAPATWVLSNHDVMRHRTRFGDGELGLRRARAAALLLLALPGPAFVYDGEELGLPEVLDLPESALQDPIWERSGHTERGRDGARVPMPWSGSAPPYGFSPDGTATWLPQPEDWGSLTVEAQLKDADSVLQLYRSALRVRRDCRRGRELEWIEGYDPAVLAFRSGELLCAVNMGTAPVRRPPGAVLLASDPGFDDGTLAPDTAVWVHAGGAA